ncbi:hypothetical protein PG997_011770 [Apiospora hydei]|uniref:Uncharacterized protein n=1 Tax=Apiospora hydei TaxID=1337664 RepID=A0ABR1V1G2_9PEZI
MSDIPPSLAPSGAHQAPARHRRPPLLVVHPVPPLRGGRPRDGQVLLQSRLPLPARPPRPRRQRLRVRRHDPLRRLVLASRARRRRRPQWLGDAAEADGVPGPGAAGVRGADGEWTAETAATPARSGGDGGIIGSGSRGGGNVPSGRFGGGGGDGARDQGGFAGGAGGEEELQDPWALPQSKKGGSSRWS